MARQRLDVNTAATVLGISADAVRKRVYRGTLESEKEADGSLFIWLDADALSSGRERAEADVTQVLREQVDYLRGQLEVWQEEARRKDHIIAALTERIPELEPARESTSEPRESPETATEGAEGVETPMKEERRSWWRRMFGE
jgi:hypothetical protein